jgi:nicotinamidase-related amidase
MVDQTTALVIIDVQAGLFEKSAPIFEADQLMANINALASRAHEAGAPVFHVQHENKSFLEHGSAGWQLHPDLQVQPGDHLIAKQHSSALKETSLGQLLRGMGVRTLVVTGLVTHGCVRHTAEAALAQGYDVVLVADGHSTWNRNAARLIQEWNGKLEAAGARVLPAKEVEFA